ncbi:MAG: hypothetical protein JWM37_428 [Candidatus Saccharibacteria bacterium]|nr:hypothetical protein [Candidatus Saccharibacteria bacterium]
MAAGESPDPQPDEQQRTAVHRQYVASLVSSYGPALRVAFGVDGLPPHEEHTTLLKATARALGMLEVAATIGRPLPYSRNGDQRTRHDPLVDMGWATLEPVPNVDTAESARSRYVVRVTDTGGETVREMRAALGDDPPEVVLARHLSAYEAQAAELEALRKPAGS